MLFVTNSVKTSVFVRYALSRANLQAKIYRTKKTKVKYQQVFKITAVSLFAIICFPYKIGQEIVAITACTDQPKIVWSSHTKVKILNYVYFNQF